MVLKTLRFGENETACRHGWSLLFVIKLSDFLPRRLQEAETRLLHSNRDQPAKILKRLSGSHCQSGGGECCVRSESVTTCCASV